MNGVRALFLFEINLGRARALEEKRDSLEKYSFFDPEAPSKLSNRE
jgi:hypothetical protein